MNTSDNLQAQIDAFILVRRMIDGKLEELNSELEADTITVADVLAQLSREEEAA